MATREDGKAANLSATAAAQLTEITKGFGWSSDTATLNRLIATFHAAYIAAEVPAGWALNDNLTLDDLEAYFDAYEAEKSGNAWHERGRTIRAAVKAGWIKEPVDVSAATVGRLKPPEATRLKNALDAHYTRLTVADPNSSGPLLTT